MGNSSISGSHFYTRETSHGFPTHRSDETYKNISQTPCITNCIFRTQVPRKASAATINQLVTGESVTREVTRLPTSAGNLFIFEVEVVAEHL